MGSSKEIKVSVPLGDPQLLGRDFYCSGSEAKGYPAYKGDRVGTEINYTLYEDKVIKEDRSCTPLRGCVFHKLGICTKTETDTEINTRSHGCPVASVTDMDYFLKHRQELQKYIGNKPEVFRR